MAGADSYKLWVNQTRTDSPHMVVCRNAHIENLDKIYDTLSDSL